MINNVNAYLYDAAGKELRHFKKKDMEDQPVFDGSSFVTDERVKVGIYIPIPIPIQLNLKKRMK